MQNEANSSQFTPPAHPDPNVFWRNRRWMAWGFGVGWAVIQTLLWVWLEWQREGMVNNLGVVIGWSYAASCGVLTLYYGGASAEHIWKRK